MTYRLLGHGAFRDLERSAIEIQHADRTERDRLVACAVTDRRTDRDGRARGIQPLEDHCEGRGRIIDLAREGQRI